MVEYIYEYIGIDACVIWCILLIIEYDWISVVDVLDCWWIVWVH